VIIDYRRREVKKYVKKYVKMYGKEVLHGSWDIDEEIGWKLDGKASILIDRKV
jgi:hypothetical protein